MGDYQNKNRLSHAFPTSRDFYLIYARCRGLSAEVERPECAIFATHGHDDLGMAGANALAAVRGGARQVECAVNGIGERAGNCALEDVVMALRTRADLFGVSTGIDTTKILAASRTLADRRAHV